MKTLTLIALTALAPVSLAFAQAEIKSFQADRQQLKNDLNQLKQRAVAAENQVAELATTLAAANHDNVSLRQQVDNDLSLAQSRLESTGTQLDLRERELANVREENSEIVQSLAGTQAELAAMGIELAGVREQLGKAEHSLQDGARRQEELSQAKHDLQNQLGQATAEGQPFGGAELQDLLALAAAGIRRMTEYQSKLVQTDFRARVR